MAGIIIQNLQSIQKIVIKKILAFKIIDLEIVQTLKQTIEIIL